MRNNAFLSLAAIILFLTMVTVNILANALPINGLDTGEVSDFYPSLFTPSGITFSIWSVIYFFLVGTVVVMWTNRNDVLIRKLLPFFCASCILNLSWILAWHYLMPGLSVVIMVLLLSVLIIMFKTLNGAVDLSSTMKIWLKFPFTIYLAWISVATIANISAFLISLNWTGGFISEEAWTVLMMFAAAALAFAITSKFDAYWYSVVVIWALLGIFIKWRGSDYDYIVYSSIVFASVLALNILYTIRRSKRHIVASH